MPKKRAFPLTLGKRTRLKRRLLAEGERLAEEIEAPARQIDPGRNAGAWVNHAPTACQERV